MQTIIIDEDIKVFCANAESFPDGIVDAHEKIHSIIPFSISRRYFGISRPENGVIVYKAAVEELEDGKEKNLDLKHLLLKRENI